MRASTICTDKAQQHAGVVHDADRYDITGFRACCYGLCASKEAVALVMLVDVVVPAAMAVPPMVMQAAVVRVRASRWARDGIGALRISVKNLTLVVAPAAPW